MMPAGINVANPINSVSSVMHFNTTPMPMDSITFRLGTNWLVEDTSKEADTPTGISEVKPQLQNAHDKWYSIGGSRLGVRPTTKGVYIRNGKKMVVK